jgi:hypothetical protein
MYQRYQKIFVVDYRTIFARYTYHYIEAYPSIVSLVRLGVS